MFDRRFVQYFDWGLLGITLLLGSLGLVTLYSAVTSEAPSPEKALYLKQLVWYGIGFGIISVTMMFNYKALDQWAHVIYALCIALLICVFIYGKYVGGARRWLALGPISIQPSELAKLAVIISLARYYSRTAHPLGFTLRELLTPFVLTVIPFIMIVRQPDLGTAMLVLLIAASITVFVKIERRSLIYILAVGTVTVPLVWFFFERLSKTADFDVFEPRPGPPGGGLQRDPVEDRHRLRPDYRQRVSERHAKRPFVSARATHRFYLFGFG